MEAKTRKAIHGLARSRHNAKQNENPSKRRNAEKPILTSMGEGGFTVYRRAFASFFVTDDGHKIRSTSKGKLTGYGDTKLEASKRMGIPTIDTRPCKDKAKSVIKSPLLAQRPADIDGNLTDYNGFTYVSPQDFVAYWKARGAEVSNVENLPDW